MPRPASTVPPSTRTPRAALGWLLAAGAATAAGCGPGDDAPGDACMGLLAGDLVVTEVFADADAPPGGSGADEGKEWFEVYNASTAPVDVEGVVINHSRPDGSSGKTHTMRAATIAPGQYLVLGNTLPDLVPAWADVGYGSDLGDLYNQDGGKFTLMCGSTELDHATYELVEPGTSRALDGGRTPDYQVNDDGRNWCAAEQVAAFEFTPENFGTPGAANADCMNVVPGMCDDGGTPRATVVPMAGDLVITEVLPGPNVLPDEVGEWFEVLVNRDVDLNDLGLDRAGDTSMPVVLSSPTCKRVTAGTYLVFARSANTAVNGMLPRVDGVFGFSLVGGSAASPGDVRLMMGATELDKLTWTSSRNGKSIQLDAGLTAPADNDVATNLCDATAMYEPNNLGTPGAANSDCGGIMPGDMCMDTGTMMLRPIVKPMMGQLALNEWMPDPSMANDATAEWFEVKATAAVDLNGLQAGGATLGMTPIIPSAGPCVRIAAGGHALLARTATANTNGMLPAVDGTFGFGLTNTGGMLKVGFDGMIYSMASWATSAPGKSIMLDTDGTQCNAPVGVPLYNGVDTGTPRAVNTPPECP